MVQFVSIESEIRIGGESALMLAMDDDEMENYSAFMSAKVNFLPNGELVHTKGLVRLSVPEGIEWMLVDKSNTEKAETRNLEHVNRFLKTVYSDGYKRGITGEVFEMCYENEVGVKGGSHFADPGDIQELLFAHFHTLYEDMESRGLEEVVGTLVRMKVLGRVLDLHGIEPLHKLDLKTELRALSICMANDYGQVAFRLIGSEIWKEGSWSPEVDSDALEELKVLQVKSELWERLRAVEPGLCGLVE